MSKAKTNEPRGAMPWRTKEPLAIRPDALGWDFLYDDAEECRSDDDAVPEGVAVIEVHGALAHHGGWWCMRYDDVIAEARYAIEQGAHTIVMDLDSPGGEAAGCFEAARSLRALVDEKGVRLIAFANESAYSAAYALATAAHTIVLPASAGVGSVGVIAVMGSSLRAASEHGYDFAVVTSGEQKADGHPLVELSDSAVERLQVRVDELALLFARQVASARGMTAESVLALEAGCFYGEGALDAGLADALMTRAEVMDLAADPRSTLPGQTATAEQESTEAMTVKTRIGKGKPAAATPAKTTQKAAASTRATPPRGGLNIPRVALSNAEEKRPAPSAEVTDEQFAELEERVTAVEEKVDESEETEEETDSSDESTDESAEGDDDPDASDESDAEGDDDADAEDDDDAAEARAIDALPQMTVRTTADLAAFAKELTGQSTIARAVGALRQMKLAAVRSERLSKRASRLQGSLAVATTESAITMMVDKACREGRITPAQKPGLIKMGRASRAELEGFLATAPARVRTLEARTTSAIVEPNSVINAGSGTNALGLTAEEQRWAEKLGVDPAKLAAEKNRHAAASANHKTH